MSKCKIIRNKLETEIKELASKSKIDMGDLLGLAQKIPCRTPSEYNIYIGECMKQKKGTMKECAIEWKEKKVLLEQEVVPTEVIGEDISAKASYDIPSKTTNIGIIDADPDSIQIIAQSLPMKAEKVIVEELPSGGVTAIKIEGEGKKEGVTVVSDIPISIKKSES